MKKQDEERRMLGKEGKLFHFDEENGKIFIDSDKQHFSILRNTMTVALCIDFMDGKGVFSPSNLSIMINLKGCLPEYFLEEGEKTGQNQYKRKVFGGY